MLARTGRWLGGHTPTGFMSQKEERVDVAGKTRSAYKLVPVAKELELVKFIYQKFAELQSVAGTVRYLAQNNIRTKNGKDFTGMAVKDILRNPVCCIAGKEAGDYFEQNWTTSTGSCLTIAPAAGKPSRSGMKCRNG